MVPGCPCVQFCGIPFSLSNLSTYIGFLEAGYLIICLYVHCPFWVMQSPWRERLADWVQETVNASLREGMVSVTLKQAVVSVFLKKPTVRNFGQILALHIYQTKTELYPLNLSLSLTNNYRQLPIQMATKTWHYIKITSELRDLLIYNCKWPNQSISLLLKQLNKVNLCWLKWISTVKTIIFPIFYFTLELYLYHSKTKDL